MAQRGKEWLAPLLFQGSSAAMTIERWIEQGLLPRPPSAPDLKPSSKTCGTLQERRQSLADPGDLQALLRDRAGCVWR
jgi:hypothetical protein